MSSVASRAVVAALDLGLPGRRLGWRATTLWVTAIWLAIVVARPDLIRLTPPLFEQDHALLSMDIAIGRAFCDSPSKISTLFRLPYEARDQPALRAKPVRAALIERAGSLGRFCLSVGSPIINNENSLMWLESWVFRLVPGISLNGLGLVLHSLRLLGLAVVSGVCLATGAGLLLSGATLIIALVVLHGFANLGLTSYPLDFTVILVSAALWTLVASAGSTPARWRVGSVVLMGAWTAFGGNLRTSHLPVYLLMAVVGGAWAVRTAGPALPSPRARTLHALVLVAAFVVGFAAFDRLAITRHLAEGPADSAHHTTWHSTVLGLAIPENELSRREGIIWADSAAWDLARRIRPDVRYIDAEYERVLAGYYRGLWRRDRPAMVAAYQLKLRTAGKQMVDVLRGGNEPDASWMRWLLRPASWLPHGGYFLALYSAFGGLAAALAWRGHPGGLLLLLLSAAAVLVHLESVLITSLYVAHYHAYLAFYLLSISVAGPVLSLGACWPSVRGRLLSEL